MKNYLLISAAGLMLLTSCSYARPGVDEEGVLVEHPLIFGKGGVDPNPVSTGSVLIAPTTKVTYVKTSPTAYEEQFQNIMSKDKIPLSYTSYITLKVKSGQSPNLIQNYGEDWYENSIQKKYRDIVRDAVSKFYFSELLGERDGVTKADSLIMNNVKEYITTMSYDMPFPVEVVGVSAGHISPSQGLLEEMAHTSEEIQKTETLMSALKNAELEIKLQELKAEAVKAFMKASGCTFNQACQYYTIKAIEEKENVQVILGGDGNTSMLLNPIK